MERKEVDNLRRWNAIVNAILIAAALFTLARVAWGLDTQDITVEWTEDGKKIATERVASQWSGERSMVISHSATP